MPWYKWRLRIIFLAAVLLWIFFLWIFFASQPSQVICLSWQMTLWIFSLFARQMHKTTFSFVCLKPNLKPMSYLCLRYFCEDLSNVKITYRQEKTLMRPKSIKFVFFMYFATNKILLYSEMQYESMHEEKHLQSICSEYLIGSELTFCSSTFQCIWKHFH